MQRVNQVALQQLQGMSILTTYAFMNGSSKKLENVFKMTVFLTFSQKNLQTTNLQIWILTVLTRLVQFKNPSKRTSDTLGTLGLKQ